MKISKYDILGLKRKILNIKTFGRKWIVSFHLNLELWKHQMFENIQNGSKT